MHRLLRRVTGVARLSAALLATGSLVFGSCLALEAETACSNDGDCAGSLICAQQHCIAPGSNAVGLRARIQPPASAELLEQQVPLLDLSTSPSVQVTLVRPVRLTGTVREAGNPGSTNEPGELEARAEGDIPGFDYQFLGPSFDGLGFANYGYELRLLPGRSYQVTFRPDDASLPPHVFELPAWQVTDGTLDFEIPARSSYVTFKGLVAWAGGAPIAGAGVTLLLPDGRAMSRRTTNEEGLFEVLLPPATPTVSVRVEAPNDGPLFPELLLAAVPTDIQSNPDDVAITAVEIPGLPTGYEAFEAQVAVHAPTNDGGSTPLSGFSVSLFGHLEGGVLRRFAVTDGDGVAAFQALPGAWEVLVEVPPGLDWAGGIHKLNLQLTAANEPPAPAVLVLPPRPRLALAVVDHAGGAVPAGQVEARRRLDPGADEALVLEAAPTQEDLDSVGIVDIPVDPGTYDIRIVPDASTGAPAWTMTGVVVEEDTAFTVTLPSPGLAHITVLTPDGDILPDVTVKLYLADDQPGPYGTRPPLLHQGLTDAGGTVDLLVPFVP